MEAKMAFDALTIAIELVGALREPVARLARSDRNLADQVRRAASSVALNIAEARRRDGRDRTHLLRVAAGSAAEVRAALDVAAAWGHLDVASLASAGALLDRELAMLWRLTHPRSR
jgi:four helix bundle protein